MTDDSLYTTQPRRFAEECLFYPDQQLGETIKPYFEVPEGVKDKLSLYKWLHGCYSRYELRFISKSR